MKEKKVMSKGKRIKELREKYELTQDQLAQKLETTKQTIFKYENGIVTNIPSDKVEKMASIFNVSPSYILGWDDTIAEKPNPKEKHVVEIFRNLNDDGQDRVIEYAEYVRDTGKYSLDASSLVAQQIAEERKAEERKAHEKKSVSAPAKHTI